MKVLIAAGGTAGHLFPAQQLATLLQKDCTVVFAGHGLTKSSYFSKETFSFFEITMAPLGRRFFFSLLQGFIQSLRLVLREKPDVVVGFGSYHTVAILLASVCLRKKILLYEANRERGKVIRLFAPFAKKVAVQFAQTKGRREVLISLFPWILQKRTDPSSARKTYGLDPMRKTMLVFGGSQGAHFFNERLPEVAWEGQVLHLAGNVDAAKETLARYQKAGIFAVVKPFESNMALAYSAADFAVCRAGAGTMAELIRYKVPSLLIPYPFAYGHQQVNAEYLKELGGAHVLVQQKATSLTIREAIEEMDLPKMEIALEKAEAQNSSLVGLDEVVRQCLNKCI